MPLIELDTATILPQWTHLAEESLEAGQVPLLVLGDSGLGLDGLPGLLALPGVDAGRTGLAQPVALVGGEASLWFLALLHRRRMAHSRASGEAAQRVQAIQGRIPPALFTGPDTATHAAGLNLAGQALLSSPLGTNTPAVDESAPLGLAWQLLPTHRTGAMNRWAWLPFESLPTPDSAQPDQADTLDPSHPLAMWTAYVGLLLALGMVLAALIF
jgi:hypothetical protein